MNRDHWTQEANRSPFAAHPTLPGRQNSFVGILLLIIASSFGLGQAEEVSWPPTLPNGKAFAVVEGAKLLSGVGAELREGVEIAKKAPRVTFHFYDCQTYEGKPWSVWGDGLAIGGKYYSAVGDHLSPEGNAWVYVFDPEKNVLTPLTNVRKILQRPDGHYTPGKIHSQLGMGKDGWIYFSTHRGSTRVALDPKNHFQGDSIFRVHPESGDAEIVAEIPLPMQCLPTGSLDGERMIWYAGSADGLNEKEPQFLAYDIEEGRILYRDDRGPYRAMILARSTGKLYFHGGKPGGKGRSGEAPLYRFDPENPAPPTRIDASVGLRAASEESPEGKVYTLDRDEIWEFDVTNETARSLGGSAVASKDYTTSLKLSPDGRFLYYIPGAHGGSEQDGTPVVQFDTRTGKKKVICFLHPAIENATGYVPIGSFGSGLSEDGSTLYVTWNGAHDLTGEEKKVPFRSVGMTMIEIPESERLTQ
ncbi:MAG: hypothetical protein P1U85_15365 [Verrucomicrobiales bacterium]|nr:hypothetical protein [Verrucomicrobiales bacterium]